MKKKNKGNYLKEVSIEFLAKEKLDSIEVRNFIDELTHVIKTKIVSLTVNELPPGFDILVGIKESCIYFGYWQQYNYCKMIVSSCRNFNEKKILTLIDGYFWPDDNIKMKVYHDKPITTAVKDLKCNTKKT